MVKNGKEHERQVRLVLIECLRGCSILSILSPPEELNCKVPKKLVPFCKQDKKRKEVFARILEGVAKQHHSGLDQNDLAARNVMIVPKPKTKRTAAPAFSRVVLIDYNDTLVYTHENFKSRPLPDQALGLPRNPAEKFWDEVPEELNCLIPKAWKHAQGLENYQKWLRKRFGGRNALRFEPILKEHEFYKS